MKWFIVFFASALAFSVSAKVVNQGDYSIAQKYQMQSKHLGESREFYISLPESYQQKPNASYPVMYLLDGGQNMMHAVASAQMLALWRGIPELIIVAIPSKNRGRDFTPSNVPSYSAQSGGGAKFMAFIKQEIAPYIEQQYRTHPFRILQGHSLGGLFAANELMQQSDFFGSFIIIAPSLWWNDFEMIKVAKTYFKSNTGLNKSVHFSIGEHDGYGMRQELKQFVEHIGQSKQGNVFYQHQEYAAEGHMSAPLKANYDGLLHVFSDIKYDKEGWDTFSAEAFVLFEQRLKQKYGPSAIQTAENYVALANHLISKGDFSGGALVYQSNAAAYPDFPPNHSWLANAYVLDGQLDKAKAQYQIAYELTASSTTGQGNAEVYQESLNLLNNPVIHKKAPLRQFVGCYASKDATFEFVLSGSTLIGKREGWRDFSLYASSQSQFFMRVAPGYKYQFDVQGEQKKLLVEAYGSIYELNAALCSNDRTKDSR